LLEWHHGLALMLYKNIRVLVVDADPAAAERIARDLEAAGHRVVATHWPEEALQRIERERFDAGVIDIGLRHGPVRAAHLALALHKRDAAVILTGGADRASGLREICFPSLIKPFDGAALLAALRDALAEHYGTTPPRAA
jgi:DNA-binding response OmpR family regulator